MELKELITKYKDIASRHKLPAFEELNTCFDIEKIETGEMCLLREVRRVMLDKAFAYMRLIEMLMNPSMGPPIFMQFSRSIEQDERKVMNDLYKKFATVEVEAIKLDLSYNESEEAALIVKTFSLWKESENDLRMLTDMMSRNLLSEQSKKEKNYFG